VEQVAGMTEPRRRSSTAARSSVRVVMAGSRIGTGWWCRWGGGVSGRPQACRPRTLAVDALDQVASERSELAELWDDAANGSKWHHDITRLRDVLDPPVPPPEEALFDI